MSKILGLAESGFGKTISASGCQEPELGIDIEGLNPKETFFISATSKPLPFRGSRKKYPQIALSGSPANLKIEMLKGYRRVITNDGYIVAKVIELLATNPSHFNVIVTDDANYLMQDYMMEKALATGWDAPKKVGHFMSKVFAAMEKADNAGKTIFMLAHYDSKKKNNKGEITFKMKTTGNQVDDAITPEGKFDVTLYGITEFNETTKKVERFYLTNNDGTFPAKSPPGMFPLLIPNDLGIVLKCVRAYYDGDEMPVINIDPSIMDRVNVSIQESKQDTEIVATEAVSEVTDEVTTTEEVDTGSAFE